MHVDENGWRTGGESRALWTATTPQATLLQIAERCDREQLNALISTNYAGIVISDRWPGYKHMDTSQRQACWSRLQKRFSPPRRRPGRAEDLRRDRPGAHGPSVRRVARLPAGPSRPQAPGRRAGADPDQAMSATRQRQPQEHPHTLAPWVRQEPAEDLARALDLHDRRRGRADQQPRRASAPLTSHPQKNLARYPKRKRRAIRRTALSPPRPADSNTLAVHLPQDPQTCQFPG